jgi:hypothetical protein
MGIGEDLKAAPHPGSVSSEVAGRLTMTSPSPQPSRVRVAGQRNYP